MLDVVTAVGVGKGNEIESLVKPPTYKNEIIVTTDIQRLRWILRYSGRGCHLIIIGLTPLNDRHIY